jgi:hypothetical protein
MTFGSKNTANGSKHSGKVPRVGKGGANLASPISTGYPNDTYHAPIYKGTGGSKKSSDGRLKKISQPGINPKGSSRVG